MKTVIFGLIVGCFLGWSLGLARDPQKEFHVTELASELEQNSKVYFLD